jgi:hypothetical protein
MQEAVLPLNPTASLPVGTVYLTPYFFTYTG